MMTEQERVRGSHGWQKIRTTEYLNEDSSVEWLEVCIFCYVERRMRERPNGQTDVIRTEPDPLPEQCVKLSALRE